MKKLSLLVSLLVLLFACNKDKFQSTPQIKIKSTSGSIIAKGSGELTVVLSYTDKEGDVDDSVYVRKIRTNQRVAAETYRDTLGYAIPEFPAHSTGDISVTLDNTALVSAVKIVNLPNGTPEPDSLTIWFKVKDKAGHMSDSVSTGTIVVLR